MISFIMFISILKITVIKIARHCGYREAVRNLKTTK